MIDTLDTRASQPELFLSEENEEFLLSAEGKELASRIETYIEFSFEEQR